MAAIALVPSIGASRSDTLTKRAFSGLRTGIGTFTPAAADPRLAAALARTGLPSTGFRFTPVASVGKSKSITVAVRAQSSRRTFVNEQLALVAPAQGVAPVAYDLGVGVGWKRFALQGDVTRLDGNAIAGGRDSADVGLSYNTKKWSTRVQIATERPTGTVPRAISGDESVALDVGGSFRLTRNLDVMAGVRYKSERYRLERPTDDRRDSQAVYVGTAFRF
ncbi:MAG: hypothetical protein ACKVOJ_02995 [Sphingomonadaceae bacterium]